MTGQKKGERAVKILRIEPGRKPEVVEIKHTLEAMQEVVGGLIQAIYPFEELVALICNDEGKLLNLPPNRALRDKDGIIYDVVCGTMFLCGAPPGYQNFCSLTQEQIEKYTALFRCPEVFIKADAGIICIPVTE